MVDRQDPLLDVVDRLGAAAELDEDGVVERVGDDAEHGLAHGGREEEVLPLGGDGVDDALHVRPEAHVEHAVGLVEHERVDLVQQDVALAEHVEQAARGRDQQVDALADALGLRVVGDAAEDGDDAAAAVGGQRLADLLDLAAQLAGRGDDEGGRMRLLAVDDHRRRSCSGGWAARRRPSCRCPSGRSPRRRGRRARAGWRAPGSASGPRSPWRRRRRAACLRGRARRTPGSRPRGPDRQAARRACAPCRTRRRPGRRGRGRGRDHARRGPCRRGRRGAGGRPGGHGSRRAHRSAPCARGRRPARPAPELPE